MNLKSEEPQIEVEIKKIKQFGDKNVRFIILYGSSVKRKLTDMSDIDLAVFYQGTKKERFDFRKKILGRVNNRFDIQTFQDLPLYIQNDIISTGKI
ncbi:MAG: nucleotidyltransferase domain-containing protein, partial [Euryarchaeota archaeon]|nr:nucleotidyltransferase domain-containing protein [Euryarchaeota archaeon]